MDDLSVRFQGTWQGRKIYRVFRDGIPVFAGTMGECKRYMHLHREKLRKELKALNTPRRQRPFVKSYRVSPRRAASF